MIRIVMRAWLASSLNLITTALNNVGVGSMISGIKAYLYYTVTSVA